jgi:DNA modification methylase
MAHASENSRRLGYKTAAVYRLTDIDRVVDHSDNVYFFRFPHGRTDEDAKSANASFHVFSRTLSRIGNQCTVCILTSPADAARLQPFLQDVLKFQLWVAVKSQLPTLDDPKTALKNRHLALLIFTRYRGSLRHAKTRIAYTYCSACGKTTKDYGGKKHVYHEYGTLMSDVWRDIEVASDADVSLIINRLSDLFGIDPYETLSMIDLASCAELLPARRPRAVAEDATLFGVASPTVPAGSKLINGDCLVELKKIPSHSVDFCFADPPYNLQKNYQGYKDSLELVKYFEWCDQWLSELARILKPGTTLATLNIPLWSIRYYQHLATLLEFQSWIVWDAIGFPVRMIMPAHYAILCFSKGRPRSLPGLVGSEFSSLENESLVPSGEFFCTRYSCIQQRTKKRMNDRGELSDLWYDIHRLKHNSRRVDHPTQLPPLLMRRLISIFTRPGELIVDCFNGAGTSTLVAQQLGRRFVGIELSEDYHRIALQRHKELSRGRDPFAKRDATPNAKNSPVPRLRKQTYPVSKKTLQLEVKRIAQTLNHLPSREEVKSMGRFPIEYYDRFFVSWGEVCAAARTTGMSELPPEKRSTEFEPELFSK